MDLTLINGYLADYGFLCLFIIVLIEYLNIPGFPSGIIMPLGGLWIHNNNLSLTQGLLITTLASIIASWILYFIGRIGGFPLLQKYMERFPKQKNTIEKSIVKLEQNSNWIIFTSKLLPIFRTVIPFPAGALKLNFLRYTVFSILGIFIWNYGFMAAGYYLGDKVLYILS
ncbi:alkaline phosphatase [Candidatus Epulonipiscioides saccharophilum]|nr:alkaline phosphatase [Epulopiscium sp. SCG-B10WGA-EpuloB]ONI48187.1 alkaline phosphatase [Epulopiscium sp. SCG-B10WGA-EpuloB]